MRMVIGEYMRVIGRSTSNPVIVGLRYCKNGCMTICRDNFLVGIVDKVA